MPNICRQFYCIMLARSCEVVYSCCNVAYRCCKVALSGQNLLKRYQNCVIGYESFWREAYKTRMEGLPDSVPHLFSEMDCPLWRKGYRKQGRRRKKRKTFWCVVSCHDLSPISSASLIETKIAFS
jgi:hypothetical protein